MGMISRIKARRKAKKPRQQYYGGDAGAAAVNAQRNQMQTEAARQNESTALGMLDTERGNAGAMLRDTAAQAGRERASASQQYANLAAQVAGNQQAIDNQYAGLGMDARRMQRISGRQAQQYGTGADQALGQYNAGRGAILGGASELEALGRAVPGQYTSAADAAFKAATERTQRNALALAAGRGNDAIRQALASSTVANQQANLDQQVTRAQEQNQLLGLQQNAITGAAGIRSGVAGQDQQAAALEAARQEAARGAQQQALATRGDITGARAATGQAATAQLGDITGANAQMGLAANQQTGALQQADAQLGLDVAGARLQSGQAGQDRYVGADIAQQQAQLGANLAYEQQRAANAQTKGFAGFMGKLAGGLNNAKAAADASDFGPGSKLLGQTKAV